MALSIRVLGGVLVVMFSWRLAGAAVGDAPGVGLIEQLTATNALLCDAAVDPVIAGSATINLRTLADLYHAEAKNNLFKVQLAMPYCPDGRRDDARLKALFSGQTCLQSKVALLVWCCMRGYGKVLTDDIFFTQILRAAEQYNEELEHTVLAINFDPESLYALGDDVVWGLFQTTKQNLVRTIFMYIFAYAQFFSVFNHVTLTVWYLPAVPIDIPVVCTNLVALSINPFEGVLGCVLSHSLFIAPALKFLTMRRVGLTRLPWALPSLYLLDVYGNPLRSLDSSCLPSELAAPQLAPERILHKPLPRLSVAVKHVAVPPAVRRVRVQLR